MENKLNEIENNSSVNLKSNEYCQNWINGTNGVLGGVYYGVYIPCDIQIQEKDTNVNVFQNKLEALKLVKKFKKARFKAFSFYHEAADFAINGAEQSNTARDINTSNSTENSAPIGEKPSPYRGPKSQDLVKLRKAIEMGNVDFVHKTIWQNPRYLISVGDTPSILQEGPRYNALHVAAKAKNEVMCKVILCAISEVSFIKLLYGEENHQDAEQRSKILLDLYFNTPDKGLNETPLHFASKFGAYKVVEVFVSFAECDKKLRNKFGKLASEIVCDRCEATEITALKEKISLLLEETYYVPVLRSEDNCMAPEIGEPFSPTSPPIAPSKSLLDSKLEIHAYAGPMEKEQAEKFRKVWKTPPRTSKRMKYDNLAILKFKDPQKGLECLGRVLASERDVGWKEYWPFLNTFIDLTSKEGLDLFEDYLKQRFNMIYGIDSSTSCVSSSSSSEKIENCASNTLSDISPITDLCNAFQLCSLNDVSTTNVNASTKSTNTILHCNDEKKTDILPEAYILKNDISPFLYVEKTCQVFANRIANDILHAIETDGNLTNTVALELQMKQVMSVIASFKDDDRFNSVNFQVVHSRISTIVADKLYETIKEEQCRDQICYVLDKWLNLCGNNLDCFSSDDESINHRQQYVKTFKKSTSRNKQVVCLLQCLLNTLNNEVESVISSSRLNNEEECIQMWSKAKSCTCILQSKHLKRNSLSKRHENAKYSMKGNVRLNGFENVSRKLTYSECNDLDTVDSEIKQASNMYNEKTDETSSSDDEYYTPPSSPSLLLTLEESDSDDDDFNDSRLPETDVFIEGTSPTKMDFAVYAALCTKNNKLNPSDYPNVYKWYHTVSLYDNIEREQWVAKSNAVGSPLKVSTPNALSSPSNILRHTVLNTPGWTAKSSSIIGSPSKVSTPNSFSSQPSNTFTMSAALKTPRKVYYRDLL